MLCQSMSSQKPGDELLANFRQQLPEVVAVTSNVPAPSIAAAATTIPANPYLQPQPQLQSHSLRNASMDRDTFGDQDPSVRTSLEPWMFNPPLLDTNSSALHAFANATPVYHMPTPEGQNTLSHYSAGHLHNPLLAVGGISTPLSMAKSGDAISTGANVMDMSGFQLLQSHQLHHFSSFMQSPPAAQQAFDRSSFVHRDTYRDTCYKTTLPGGAWLEASPPGQCIPFMPTTIAQPRQQETRITMMQGLDPNTEDFRFHSILNAPTAMIKHADEIPITYLNKGQTYSLFVIDTNATGSVAPGAKYRTFVRVSFEEDEQRQKPGVCWGIWKKGRGTNEAPQRGGKLQAVEYVEPGQSAEMDERKTKIELEGFSFDGFCVTWTTGASGIPVANIALRFNFLSTDFSYSKGVKGIPVRLCAKTNLVLTEVTANEANMEPEVCFCKVKLFRDHGAERKLSGDTTLTKKSIDRTKQQLAQIESEMMKNHGGTCQAFGAQRPGKVRKQKRTRSLSSASSAGFGIGAGRITIEEDLQIRLQALQDMFTSSRPVSVLYLRGEHLDDPDRYPVTPAGAMSPPFKLETFTIDDCIWQARGPKSSVTGLMASPSPSFLSVASQTSGVLKKLDAAASGRAFEQLSKVNRMNGSRTISGWSGLSAVNTTHRLPQPTEKAVACFYVHYNCSTDAHKPSYYRAIFLTKRTIEDFSTKIATKWGIDPTKVVRTIRSVHGGLEVEVDDDVIRELREGQDMTLEIEETTGLPKPTKRKWGVLTDDDEISKEPVSSTTKGLVLRLFF